MYDKFRLHNARVKNGIDLAEISARTALSPGVVQHIDEGRFDQLPPGLYARAYIRLFAKAVGVAPDEALQDVAELLPQAQDPIPALREHAPPSSIESLKALLASQTNPFPLLVAGYTARRAAASLVDAAVLLVIGVLMTALVSWVTGVSVRVLLDEAGVALAVMFAVPVMLYFLLLDAVGHRTLGAAICGTAGPTRIVIRITTLSSRAPREACPIGGPSA